MCFCVSSVTCLRRSSLYVCHSSKVKDRNHGILMMLLSLELVVGLKLFFNAASKLFVNAHSEFHGYLASRCGEVVGAGVVEQGEM